MPGARRRRPTTVADYTRSRPIRTAADPSPQRGRSERAPSDRHRTRPDRYWGWHRLQADWADRLVAGADLGPGDLVLDLGAGDGALTAPLAAAGAEVLAIELHPARAHRLRRRFADLPQVRVLELDLLDLRLPSRPYSVLANPPWSLAKPLIGALTGSGTRLRQADLVLPRGLVGDLGRRGTAGTGRRAHFRAEYLTSVPRQAFSPIPPGPAAVLRLSRGR